MTIINIQPHNFGGLLRNGDMIGALNVLEHLREQNNDSGIRFHLGDDTIQPSQYCKQFRDWLICNTNYLSAVPGNNHLDISGLNIWDYRSIAGDKVSIPNVSEIIQGKIVIFPLLDAPYNIYRNWSIEMTNDIIDHFMHPVFDGASKYVCIDTPHDGIQLQDFKYSHSFPDNINHILTCNHYVGGDTGMSHFVSALSRHRFITYYYGSVGLLHTTPFYALQGKGIINLFWNGHWRTDNIL